MANEETTAVATTTAAPINTGARNALERLSQEGRAAVERQRELKALANVIEGLSWGSVQGASLSPATRYAMAEFCRITRANPLIHVDMLGGKPYLNNNYYSDLCNSDPAFIDYVQHNLSPGVEDAYRKTAERALQDAKILADGGDADGADEARKEAGRLLAEARYIETRRIHYKPDSKASHVYETVLRRYVNGAPIAKILAGEVEAAPYIKEVRECNWAGTGDSKDPIGNNDPSTTAKTRSFRRCARFAFPAWMENKDEEIRRAEKMIEGEFEVIGETLRREVASLPAPGEEQAVAASGEPEAQRVTQAAKDLPQEFDAADARKRFFATFRDAGITEDRKAWAVRNGLPESTGEWGKEEYRTANDILLAPTVAKVMDGARALGLDLDHLEDHGRELIGRTPDTLKDWKEFLQRIIAMADADEQASLV